MSSIENDNRNSSRDIRSSGSGIRNIVKTTMAFACAVLLMTGIGGIDARAATYSTSGVAKSTDATTEQYNALVNTLRGMAEAGAGAQNVLWDTGIVCGSYEEFKDIENALKHLFLADDRDIIMFFNKGYSHFDTELSDDGGYTVTYSSRYSAPEKYGHIYAGFLPGTDGAEVMRQHDAADAVINSILQAAPEDMYEKCRFFNDWISNNNCYDWEGANSNINMKTTVYNVVCEGSSVCEGYANTFFVLCHRSGIYSAYVRCLSDANDPDSLHAINAVNLDGRWKKIDVTWNDTDPGIRYTYFMIDMNDKWQDNINKPYCTVSEV
ncbi:MAG: transglutaminase domain-containing protein [Clostridiales bacterium]|nr:transglutaminase domain-containing protein [Clostridiales bacterium]